MKRIDRLSCKGFLIYSILLFCICLVGCNIDSDRISQATKSPGISQRSIYSWNRELFNIDSEIITRELSAKKIGTVYQGLYPADFSEEELSEIVKEYRSREIEIAYLVGDPSWKDCDTVIHWALEPLVCYNNKTEKESRINKVCFDIEFFLSDTETTVEEYTQMMKGIYDYCHKNFLQVVICLPYWIPDVYGKQAFKKILNYADALSCTVFLKGQEELLLQTAVDLCHEKGKKIEAVLDLQPESEKYRVHTTNTYYYEGLQKALEVSEQLEKRFSINASLHHLTEYRNLLNKNDI